jgi:hypothetical protein
MCSFGGGCTSPRTKACECAVFSGVTSPKANAAAQYLHIYICRLFGKFVRIAAKKLYIRRLCEGKDRLSDLERNRSTVRVQLQRFWNSVETLF